MRFIIGLVFVLYSIALPGYAQKDHRQSVFQVPFDFPLLLSSNFGELRSNHFHGGLDFKTQGVVGKPIRCIADGYISRVSVTSGGYGRALYVTHSNGYTSVYGHLDKFPLVIADTLKRYQYKNETFVADITFQQDEFPVRSGEVLAYAGNSGYSFGPHLHMEIRETETNEPIDPLIYYWDKIKDTTPPRATSVMFYPQRGKGVVGSDVDKRSFSFGQGHTLQYPVEAWGLIGVGISANDYMDGTNNSYGVNSVTLKVDGVEVFRSNVDRFGFNENRMINAWTDYEEFRLRKKWYMKSFVEPGNSLRLLHTSSQNGLILINQERDYHFEYTLVDLHGNQSTYSFIVRGVNQLIPDYVPSGNHYLRCNQANIIQKSGLEMIIPRGLLYTDADIQVKVETDTTAYSHRYRFSGDIVPLHDFCRFSLGVVDTTGTDSSKFYVALYRNGKLSSMGGTYKDGWLSTQIREILPGGEYFVAVDTIAPKVVAIGKAHWVKQKRISFKIGDAHTGIKSFRGEIDGRFVLFEFDSKALQLTCRLDESPVVSGREHTLSLVVTDYCGNQTYIQEKFRY